MTRAWMSLAVLLAAAVPVVAGCSSNSSSTPPAISAAAYQQQLTDIQNSLSQDRATVLAADNPAALGAAIARDRRDIAGAVAQLGRLTPPTSMQTEQRGLITALTSYGGELGSMGTETAEGKVCLGWAALAQVAGSSSVAQLRGTTLAGAVPTTAADATTPRPANGTMIKRPGKGGQGELTVVNTGGNTDAMVELVLTGHNAATLAVYVHAASSSTVHGVTDGTFTPYIATGAEWDPLARQFAYNCGFQKMDAPIQFTTTTQGSTINYVQETITITPVTGGNVSESDVPVSQFPKS